jgi:hypothetical protein
MSGKGIGPTGPTQLPERCPGCGHKGEPTKGTDRLYHCPNLGDCRVETFRKGMENV